jgi:hypothetical protein
MAFQSGAAAEAPFAHNCRARSAYEEDRSADDEGLIRGMPEKDQGYFALRAAASF